MKPLPLDPSQAILHKRVFTEHFMSFRSKVNVKNDFWNCCKITTLSMKGLRFEMPALTGDPKRAPHVPEKNMRISDVVNTVLWCIQPVSRCFPTSLRVAAGFLLSSLPHLLVSYVGGWRAYAPPPLCAVSLRIDFPSACSVGGEWRLASVPCVNSFSCVCAPLGRVRVDVEMTLCYFYIVVWLGACQWAFAGFDQGCIKTMF